jgi:excisionase family DNA binding protein
MAARKTRKGAVGRTAARTKQEDAQLADWATDLLDAGGAIELLRTTRPTFYRWLRTGKINGLKVGRQWRFERAEIERFLKGEEPRIELRADIAPFVDELRERADALGAPALGLPEETAVKSAIAQVIRLGLIMHASDIHVHPLAEETGQARKAVVRYRIDGVLHSVTEFDIRLLAPIMEQWKALGACDPHQLRRPQDARMIFETGHMHADQGVRVDLGLSFLPSTLGESLTCRILDLGTSILSLDRIDYAPRDRERLLRALGAPSGLILLTGPAGSGKTTNLYSCLQHVSRPEIKVVTIEDPVEYVYPWMVQTQVDPSEGATFARLLRSALRSDPDVIMIGELLDGETANLSLQAAMTGHLVFTTLHADDTARALLRLVEMECPPFVIGDAARLVLAQRLVRLLCPHCSRETAAEPQRLAWAEHVARAGGLDWDSLPKRFRSAAGCDQCKQLGYRGRNIITEVMEVSPEIGAALRRGASVNELRTIAVGQGMTTMSADGIRKAAEGKTTLEEVFRLLPHEAA